MGKMAAEEARKISCEAVDITIHNLGGRKQKGWEGWSGGESNFFFYRKTQAIW